MISQQLSPLLLQLHPFPHPLLPQQHIRMMIQRMQLQEFPLVRPQPLLPQLLPHPLPHPHLSSHPQFVAAKSLMKESSKYLFTLHFMKGTCPG